MTDLINVEVAYALPQKQVLKALAVAPGTTALQAIEHSGILQDFPEIDTNSDSIGVFSQVLGTKGLDEPAVYQLQAMDRVEIYRPLIADPKEVRRRRAEEAKAKREQD
ncbi:MAG: RnfH family protein [Porticoccaceae bacterium]|jgi:putative ubiquitin-RnfH superfamily antitoxin RatB of RatAB toxin-antitoxin module